MGNPVREEIAAVAAAGGTLRGRRGPLRLLVLGGSQGALALNKLLPAALALLARNRAPSFATNAGSVPRATAESAYAGSDVEVELVTVHRRHGRGVRLGRSRRLPRRRADGRRNRARPVCRRCSFRIQRPSTITRRPTRGPMTERGAALIVQERDLTPESLARRSCAIWRSRIATTLAARAATRAPERQSRGAFDALPAECLRAGGRPRMINRMRRIHRVHFVGIGGSGMSGIAEVMLSLGYAVQGSDPQSQQTDTAPRRPGRHRIHRPCERPHPRCRCRRRFQRGR